VVSKHGVEEVSGTPLQNRVTPTGEIVADPARGLLLGNRGCLHRADRTLGTEYGEGSPCEPTGHRRTLQGERGGL
jgi:hypothetical protein